VRQTRPKADFQKVPIRPPLVGRIHEKNIGGKAFPDKKAERGENVRAEEPKATLYAAQLQILADQTTAFPAAVHKYHLPGAAAQGLDPYRSRACEDVHEDSSLNGRIKNIEEALFKAISGGTDLRAARPPEFSPPKLPGNHSHID